MAKPSLLPKHRRRITTFPLYRPLLRRHQLIVESSGLLVAVVVPSVPLLPLAVVVPPVEVVVPPVALLPLAVVAPRLCPTHCRRVLPIAVVVRPSKLLYNIVYNTAVFTYSVAHWLVADLLR